MPLVLNICNIARICKGHDMVCRWQVVPIFMSVWHVLLVNGFILCNVNLFLCHFPSTFFFLFLITLFRDFSTIWCFICYCSKECANKLFPFPMCDIYIILLSHLPLLDKTWCFKLSNHISSKMLISKISKLYISSLVFAELNYYRCKTSIDT